MNTCFVALEGFQLGKTLIVKELYLLAEQGDDHKHFMFLPPAIQLSPEDKRTVRYSTRYLHGLGWNEGDVPYYSIEGILRKIQNYTVYCYGYTTTNFLRTVLPCTVVIDTQKEGYVMSKLLPRQRCFTVHNSRHCAMAKAHAVRDFIRNFAEYVEDEKPCVDDHDVVE